MSHQGTPFDEPRRVSEESAAKANARVTVQHGQLANHLQEIHRIIEDLERQKGEVHTSRSQAPFARYAKGKVEQGDESWRHLANNRMISYFNQKESNASLSQIAQKTM